MSSVTRLHLLSQSMLNVSCQKQKHCSSLPAESLLGSPMEFVGQPSLSEACSLLGVPGLSSVDVDVDDDEGDIVIGIRPKSSPLPRRKSSLSDEDSEPVPPLCGSRRVSFADSKGLELVQVKEFDIWDVPKLPDYDSSEGREKDSEEYFISPFSFSLPLSTEELFTRVRDQKLELETIELLPGTTTLKGVIRVLNVSFDKAVYVRTTLDSWSTHFDLLAEYIPGSSEGLMDCFSFKLTLVPPFGEQGVRVDFCLRYETTLGAFWANNNGRNYILFCHQRAKEEIKKPHGENVKKKSCLKIVGQNFSSLEDISAMEASSCQETNKTDVSKREEEAETLKAKDVFDDQSGASEEDGQKLTKSRRNCSRRSRRKAARMARVRDYFSQRNGAADSKEDESLSEAQQVDQEDQHSDVNSLSEESSGAEDSQYVSRDVGISSEPLIDVLQGHDYTSSNQTETSESIGLADSSTLTGGESASDIPDNMLHSIPASAELNNTNKSVSTAEGSTQKDNSAAEAQDGLDSAVSSDSLVSPSNSFTFGTVVAPLYRQAFGRAGTESQSSADEGNSVKATPNIEDRETRCTVPTDTSDSINTTKGNVNKTLESSNKESLDLIKEEETSFSATPNDILDNPESLQVTDELKHSNQTCTNASEVPKMISAHPNTVSVLSADVLDKLILAESSDLQGEAQEKKVTHDPQSQTTAEKAEDEPSEQTCTQVQTGPHETHAQSLDTSLKSSQSESGRVGNETEQHTCSSGEKEEGDIRKIVTESTTIVTSGEDTVLEAFLEAAKDTLESSESCLETLKGKDDTALQVSLKTQEKTYHEEGVKEQANSSHMVDESVMMMRDDCIYGDVTEELQDEDKDTLKQEETKHLDLADFCSSEVKNWEMMVEEEEISILTDEEEICIQAGDIEAVEEDHIEQFEDVGREIISENRDTSEKEGEKTDDEVVQEITQKREAEAADISEDEQRIREEKEEEGVRVQANKMRERDGEKELTERTDVGTRDDHKVREQDFTKFQDVTFKRRTFRKGEAIERIEEIHLSTEDEAGVKIDEVKQMLENEEEKNPDKKNIPFSAADDEGSDSVKTEDRENEAVCFEERSESTQNKVEDGLSALVNNVQEGRVNGTENTGEVQHAHIQTKTYTEGDFQTHETITCDSSKADRDEEESTFADGGSYISDDTHDIDRTSHDGASSESDSDDEVELYMHCLRAVHTGAQAGKDRNKDTGFSVGRRSSINRGKLLSTPMPSISESVDEDQNISCLQDNVEDMETTDFQSVAAPQPAESEQDMNRKLSWWRETFSCRNIGKAFLYVALFLFFLLVAYHYDFMACFGLYLMSLVWLWFQGERQAVKNSKNRLN
ncbi:protein phosphatase 1 regulatory subunit 3A [Notolabrus celidotus]|uniref:protein phosphatase 1 regulatory subunit 3A n=1 Tax=Notolabrus celidotus TaxID=1203425 RepID=UPI00149067A1|nr:protein phosphatase 1 regulatory subunit 3A [Notolabrus celidotus]